MVPRRPGHISSKATASPRDGQRRATSPVELCRRRREALQRPAMLLPASTGRPLEKTTQKARFQPTHCSRALRGGSSPSKQREAARFHTVTWLSRVIDRKRPQSIAHLVIQRYVTHMYDILVQRAIGIPRYGRSGAERTVGILRSVTGRRSSIRFNTDSSC